MIQKEIFSNQQQNPRSRMVAMLINFEMDIRRRIMTAPIGEVVVMPTGSMPVDVARERAIKFARSRRLPIAIIDCAEGLSFKRVADDGATMYAEMDALAIGESHLYEIPAPLHQRVRMAASSRNRSGKALFSCVREGGAIRVTRHPLTPDEIKSHGLIAPGPSASKYGLERLETIDMLMLSPSSPAEIRAMRVAVSTYGQNNGWKLTCRKMEDGHLKVARHRDEEDEHV